MGYTKQERKRRARRMTLQRTERVGIETSPGRGVDCPHVIALSRPWRGPLSARRTPCLGFSPGTLSKRLLIFSSFILDWVSYYGSTYEPFLPFSTSKKIVLQYRSALKLDVHSSCFPEDIIVTSISNKNPQLVSYLGSLFADRQTI